MATEKAPMVGSFPASEENSSRLPRKEDNPPAQDPEEESPKEDGVSLLVNDNALSFEQRLQKVGLSLGDARLIMDTILTNGYYEETVAFNTEKKVVLRTRTYEDTLRAQKFLELESPTFPIAINDLIARYNTAASLARFGDQDFSKPEGDKTPDSVEAAFERRYEFLMRLPTVVVVKLMGLVHKFDIKMQAVFDEGAPKDF